MPNHVDKAVRSVTELHSDHRGSATTPQRAVTRLTALLARPWFIALVALIVAVWIAGNLVVSTLGFQAIDPPPFPWLEVVALFSLFVVMLVLVALDEAMPSRRHSSAMLSSPRSRRKMQSKTSDGRRLPAPFAVITCCQGCTALISSSRREVDS
jgi:hypothetical protein